MDERGGIEGTWTGQGSERYSGARSACVAAVLARLSGTSAERVGMRREEPGSEAMPANPGYQSVPEPAATSGEVQVAVDVRIHPRRRGHSLSGPAPNSHQGVSRMPADQQEGKSEIVRGRRSGHHPRVPPGLVRAHWCHVFGGASSGHKIV